MRIGGYYYEMVLAIINYDDSRDVISSLMKAGFSITKLATTGEFPQSRQRHDPDRSGREQAGWSALSIIREHSSSRKQIMPATAELGMGFSRPRRCRLKSAAQPYLYSTSSVLKAVISFDALAGNNALKNSLKHALNEAVSADRAAVR